MSELPLWSAREKDDESARTSDKGELLVPSAEASSKSELRGKLLEQVEAHEQRDAEELSNLRGSLVEQKAPEHEPFSFEWLKTQTFVQRDSDMLFTVESIITSKNGNRVRLKNTTLNQTITLNLDQFVEKLKTPEGAWNLK